MYNDSAVSVAALGGRSTFSVGAVSVRAGFARSRRGGAARRQVSLVFLQGAVNDGNLDGLVHVGAVFADGDVHERTRAATGGAQNGRIGGLVKQRVGVLLDRDLGLGAFGSAQSDLDVIRRGVVHSTDHAAGLVLARGNDQHVPQLHRSDVGARSVRGGVLLGSLLGVNVAAAGQGEQSDAQGGSRH